jgi:hypothetical protein
VAQEKLQPNGIGIVHGQRGQVANEAVARLHAVALHMPRTKTSLLAGGAPPT